MINTNKIFKTPILFLVFNRPSCTEKVFKAIAAARPSKLYVAADGARSDRIGEIDLCSQVRSIATKVDWECEVETRFQSENLGCREAVSGAIDWFFEHEEEGIILEDDCLPSSYFFDYAATSLARYRDNPKVMHIGGINFQSRDKTAEKAYYFSNIPQIWGWATWRRAWKCYDRKLSGLREFVVSGRWRELNEDIDICYYWIRCFYSAWSGKINTWDYQWIFSVLENNGLSVSPAVNLIENIGFSDDATHTKTGFTQGLPTEKDIIDLKSLPAPTVEEVDRIKDDFVFKKIWHTKEGNVCFLWRLKKLIRRRYKTKKMIKEITHIASI
ncbi:MAG: hypothetical protein MK130_05890 [Puniceicoccaceae bacterium]|nr:hypothetical protein [Puniceicoccaceae bacterium]